MAEQQKTWTGKAIVARDTLANKGWELEEVTTREIHDDELLVELVASGICHTDIMCGSGSGNPDLFYYPRVLGHEGRLLRKIGKYSKADIPSQVRAMSKLLAQKFKLQNQEMPSCYHSIGAVTANPAKVVFRHYAMRVCR
jgi:hypothetical protein